MAKKTTSKSSKPTDSAGLIKVCRWKIHEYNI